LEDKDTGWTTTPLRKTVTAVLYDML
jgi:hypothetical protein